MAGVLLRQRPLDDGILERAIRLLDEALPFVEKHGPDHEVTLLYGNRAWALFQRGMHREALRDSLEVVARFDALLKWDRLNAFIQAAAHAQIRAAVGDHAEAATWARTARGLADEQKFGENSPNPEIRRHLAWVDEYLGDGETP
jgi:tetratricopeptide (TPR) repeat protein